MRHTVKLGSRGCGFMGQGLHPPTFPGNPGCAVAAPAEAWPRLGRAVAGRHGIPRLYANRQELAGDREIEAVAAIRSDALNCGIAADLLAIGKHVSVERPHCGSSPAVETSDSPDETAVGDGVSRIPARSGVFHFGWYVWATDGRDLSRGRETPRGQKTARPFPAASQLSVNTPARSGGRTSWWSSAR
jgi:hypothetical protein